MAGPGQFIFIGLICLGLGSLFLWLGFNKMKKYRVIADTPTSKIRSMAMGLVEINGKANCKAHFITPFSRSPCVFYKYEIQEYVRETTGSGKNRHTRTYWKTIAVGERRQAFFATDETGTVNIEPTGAQFDVPAKKIFLQRAGLFGNLGRFVNMLKNWDTGMLNPLNIEGLKLEEINNKKFGFNNVGDRKYYEHFIAPDEQAYVLGTAVNEASNVFIKKGTNESTFIISNKSEKELLKSLKVSMILFLIFGGGIVTATIVVGIMAMIGNI